MKIAIVDYGMGNIKSITSTLIFLGVDEVLVTNNFDELKNAEKIILSACIISSYLFDSTTSLTPINFKVLEIDLILPIP
jgi:hypothetical protein